MNLALLTAMIAGAVVLAVPLLFAALGETVVEKTGRLNLGIEGMMIMGALAGVWGSSVAGPWAGLVLAAVSGILLAAIMNVAVYRWHGNEVVVGIAISMLGVGLSTFLFQLWLPAGTTNVSVSLLPKVVIPGLSELPLVGKALFGQGVLTYVAIAAIIALSLMLRRTRIGLELKSAGMDAASATLRGVDVEAVRKRALLFGGMMAAVGGAAITVGDIGSFSPNITEGRGYIALAIVIVGRCTPIGALGGALLFAAFESVSFLGQGLEWSWPTEAYAALPYLVTLAVLIASGAVARRNRAKVIRA